MIGPRVCFTGRRPLIGLKHFRFSQSWQRIASRSTRLDALARADTSLRVSVHMLLRARVYLFAPVHMLLRVRERTSLRSHDVAHLGLWCIRSWHVLTIGMWKRLIVITLPPLPLPFCSSNTSSYPTHRNGSGQSLK